MMVLFLIQQIKTNKKATLHGMCYVAFISKVVLHLEVHRYFSINETS